MTTPNRAAEESSESRVTTYQPDDGLLMLGTGIVTPVGTTAFAFVKASDDPVGFWVLVLWGFLFGGVALAIGIRRRATHRAVGGRWAELPEGATEPDEPFRFLSGNASKDAMEAGAPSREPLLMAVVGGSLLAGAVGLQFVSPADATDGLKATAAAIGALFGLMGIGSLVTSIVRLRWMVRYRRVVGHSPW